MHSWLSVPHSQQFGNRVRVGTNFVGTQALEVLALAEEHAHVRAEEFVSRAHQEIAIERGHVDQAVRAVVDGVDVGEGAGGVGEADDFFYRIDGADGVGGVSGGDELRLGIDFRGEVGHVEGAVFVVDLGPADGHAAIFCHGEPGGNVGVVVEAGDDDFVAGLQIAADGAGDGEGQRGHVRTEDDFVGAAVQEVGHGGCGLRRSWRRCGGWWRRLRRCWRCRGAGSRRWRRSRAAELAFRRGRRGRRRGVR